MRVVKQLIFLLSMIIIPTYSKIVYTGKEKVTVLGGFESKNSFISYVAINGRKYILKQKKDSAMSMIKIVREALASYISHDLDVAQEVEIVSAKKNILGRTYPTQPASLHSIAAGKMVQELPENNKYIGLCLKQRIPYCDPSHGRWFNEIIIHQMTWHWQLPIIVALDLYIANTDRHRGNLFYDEKTDRFCGIDMDNIFRYDVPGFACQNLEKMVKVLKKKFTKKEMRALTKVRDTLEFLEANFPPDDIIAKLHLFAQRTADGQKNKLYTQVMIKEVEKHEKMIIQNCANVKKLIVLLNTIIHHKP